MTNMALCEIPSNKNRDNIDVLLQKGWATFADLEKIGLFAGKEDEVTMDARIEFTTRIVDRFLADDYNKNKLFVSRELTPEDSAIKFLWIARAEKLDKARGLVR